ncbi:MAG: DoxX family membrane protein [Spirochaetaceae bacterium]|nr:DoxX family membrane protein [Spirochaetaceae bacterium]
MAGQRLKNIERTVFLGARLLIGAVFLYASYDKILNPHAFAEAIYNYQLLPEIAINPVALVLPWVELLLGLCLIAGLWLNGASLLSVLLLGAFTAALVFNQVRGLDAACGCFTTRGSHGAADLETIIRDFCLLAVAIYLAVRTRQRFEKKQKN